MGEHALNETVALSTASITSADLQVDNGQIVDGAGNSVTIGVIEDDAEQEFGDPDEGVTQVKNATPTGNLEVIDGNINVNGYGNVTLEGPNREVSTVGGANGEDGSIEVDSNGDLYIQYETSGWSTTNEYGPSCETNTQEHTFSSGDFDTDNDGRAYGASVQIQIDSPVTGGETIKGQIAVDYDGNGTVDDVFTDEAVTESGNNTYTLDARDITDSKPASITVRPGLHNGEDYQYLPPGTNNTIDDDDSVDSFAFDGFIVYWEDYYESTTTTNVTFY